MVRKTNCLVLRGLPRQHRAAANLRTVSVCNELAERALFCRLLTHALVETTRRQSGLMATPRRSSANAWHEGRGADVAPPEINGQGRARNHRPRHAVQGMPQTLDRVSWQFSWRLRRRIIVFWVASPPDATMRAEIRRETTLRRRPESPLARFHGEGPVVSAAGFAADKVLRIGE